MRAIRILYISHLHPPHDAALENMGGMQRVSMQLVDELDRRRDVELRAITLETSWEHAAINTTRFLARLFGDLPPFIRQIRPDVVLFSSMVTASLAVWLRRLVDVPLVGITHGQDVTLPVPVYQGFVPHVFRALDGVVSVSGATRDACLERGLDARKGRVIPNGYPRHAVPDLDGREAAELLIRTRFFPGKPAGSLLLTAGRLVRRKGHAWFIRNVLPKITRPVRYLIVGDGPEMEDVQRSIAETGVQERVVLTGRQPDEVLQAAYLAADLFVMPNIPVPGDMEGFGIVLLEANLAATPAVASDLEGIRDVVADGQNGYRVPPNEAAGMAACIDRVLEGDTAKLGLSARAYVQARFSWKSVAQQYVDYLKRIVDHNESVASVSQSPGFE